MYHSNREVSAQGTILNLKNTAKYPFKNFKISGNHSQDLTPILPEGYTQLDYIEGTGTQYIDLGYYLGNNSKVEISIDVERAKIDGTNYGLFGGRTDFGTKSFVIFGNAGTSSMRWDVFIDGVHGSKMTTRGLLEGNNIVIKDGFYNYLNGVKLTDNVKVDIFQPNYTAYLLAINTANTPTAIMPAKIRYFKAWIDGTLKFNLLPAKRKSDGKIGLYDLVNNKFLTSASSTDFTAGTVKRIPSINDKREIRAVGDNINIFDSLLMTGNSAINFIDLQVKPNTAYTFSTNIPKTYDGSNAYIFATNRQHGYTTAGNGVWEGQKRTIISDNDGYISLAYRKDSNISSYDDYWYKIEKGTKATNWSKYGQGCAEIKKCNKNVLKIDDGNKRSNGITTIAKDGILILNGTCTTNFADITNINKNKIKPGTYIFSKDTNKYTVILRVFYEDGKMTDFYLTKTSFNSKCIISKNVRSYYLFITLNKDETIDNEEIKVQLETSDTATDIILHQEEIYTLPIQKPMLKGDYFDLARKKEVHIWEKVVLDGSISPYTYHVFNKTVRFDYKNILGENVLKVNENKILCDSLYTSAYNDMVDYEHIRNSDVNYYTYLILYIDKSNASSISKLNELLAKNPVTVWYKLETPIELDLTEEQVKALNKLTKSKAYEDVTNIYSTDEISPILDVTAYRKLSDEFKERLLSGKVTRAYLRVLPTNAKPEMIIDENNFLKDVKFEELRYVPNEGFIGGTVAKRVTGNFNNVDSDFTIQILCLE